MGSAAAPTGGYKTGVQRVGDLPQADRVRREGEEIAGVFPPAASLHQTGFPQPGHYPAYPDRVGADILCQRFAVEGFRLMVEENQSVNAENKIAVQKPSPLYFVL